MGFFDNIFKRGKAYSGARNSKMACELTVDGESYMLEEFDAKLEHGTNQSYIPLYAVFSERLMPKTESWIMSGVERKNVVVKYYKNDDKMDEGALFAMGFGDVMCVRHSKKIRGEVALTTLVLAAKRINIEGEDYDAK